MTPAPSEYGETGGDAAAPVLDRLTGVEASAALERLSGVALVTGGANLLGLDAVRKRLSERWPSKREQVWEYVERCLGRNLGVQGWHVRVTDIDYLVVMPGATRFAAQALCLNILKEALTFFLGEARATDMVLREVTEISGDSLSFRTLEPHELAAAALDVAPAEPRPQPAPRPDAATWTTHVSQDGRNLRISCEQHPFFELSQVNMIGHRMRPKVQNMSTGGLLTQGQIDALDWGDRERVDVAMLQRGLARLKADRRSAQKPGLIIPLAFSTLSSSRGRAALVQAFCDARDDLSMKAVVSIRNVKGVPTSRLVDIVSLIQPFCIAVTAMVEPDRRSIERMARCGLKGLGFEYDRRFAADDEQLYGWLKGLAEIAKPVAPAVVIAGLSSPRQLAIARLAGMTHASLSAPGTNA